MAIPNMMNHTDLSNTLSAEDNETVMNIPQHAGSEFVDFYVTPFIYAMGFPGNILSFLIWSQRRMRQSSGCYLATLAMADLLFLVLHMIFEAYQLWGVPILDTPVICEAFPIIFLACQYLSPLLVLGFTIERYVSICHPFQREKFCTTRRAIRVIIGLICFAFALCAIQGYFYTYNRTSETCDVRESVTVNDTSSLWTIWTWVTEMLIFFVVPLCVLTFNLLVIKEANRLSQEDTVRLNSQQRKSSATTVTLMAVSFYLIGTTLPVTITYALSISIPQGDFNLTDEQIAVDPTWQRYLKYTLAKVIIGEIGITHYACNFIIYCITGKIFRAELVKLIGKLVCCFRDSTFTDYKSIKTCVGQRKKNIRVTIDPSTSGKRAGTMSQTYVVN